MRIFDNFADFTEITYRSSKWHKLKVKVLYVVLHTAHISVRRSETNDSMDLRIGHLRSIRISNRIARKYSNSNRIFESNDSNIFNSNEY